METKNDGTVFRKINLPSGTDFQDWKNEFYSGSQRDPSANEAFLWLKSVIHDQLVEEIKPQSSDNMSDYFKNRVTELKGLRKYARDQFSQGMIDAQIKYWNEAISIYTKIKS